MIGVTPPRSDAALHVIEGGLSPSYLTQFARAHDDAGFDLALVGCTSSSAEGFLVALHAAAHAKHLGYLVAHRPGFVAPTLMARKIATFDHLTNGRLAVHIITGKTDDEQQGDGDFSPKTERYRRAAEYLELMKLACRASDHSISPANSTGSRAPLPMYARSRSRTRCCSSAPPRMARSRWV
jgi:alkanesulfonate monooxygenase